jgi:hypothetical protein
VVVYLGRVEMTKLRDIPVGECYTADTRVMMRCADCEGVRNASGLMDFPTTPRAVEVESGRIYALSVRHMDLPVYRLHPVRVSALKGVEFSTVPGVSSFGVPI